ncbi:MAG: CdaR family protein, partial [Bryobacteraceae bacterium]
MKRLLTRNLGWKLFSLAIAAFLWLTYARDPELGTFISVPVAYKAMPDELEIGSDLVASVSLDVRGASDKVHAFSASRESAVLLDFSGILKPGEHTFHIDEHNVKLPAGVRLIRAIPSQIRLQFERRVVRQVPVQVRFAGAPQKGY